MTRAKNDRNIIKFGPTRAGLDPELKILRDENRRLEFRLNQQALILPEPGVPVTPPVVVPGDLNTVLAAGFPYVLNTLGDVFGPTYTTESAYTKAYPKKVIRETGGIVSSNGFMVTGRNNVHFVDIPSGAVTSVPTTNTSITNAIMSGNKLVYPYTRVNTGREELLSYYDFSTGQYGVSSLSVPDATPNVLNAFNSLKEEYGLASVSDETRVLYSRNAWGREIDSAYRSDAFVLDDSGFYVARNYTVFVRSTSGGGWPSSPVTRQVIGLHRFDNETLERTDQYTGMLGAREVGYSASQFGFYASSSLVRQSGIMSSYEGEVFHGKASSPPNRKQIEKGFVDNERRLVYMDLNRTSGLWEVVRIDRFGVTSRLPLVFSGDPSDQPSNVGVSVSNNVANYSTSSDRIPGVAPGPNNGYFIYGGVLFNTGTYLVSVPAIWYTDGVNTQRIWTLPDSPEYPIDLLYYTGSHGGGSSQYSLLAIVRGALECSVSYLSYSLLRQEIEFVVSVGKYDTGVDGTRLRNLGGESRVYRAKL
jgi:hypothetical protein